MKKKTGLAKDTTLRVIHRKRSPLNEPKLTGRMGGDFTAYKQALETYILYYGNTLQNRREIHGTKTRLAESTTLSLFEPPPYCTTTLQGDTRVPVW